MPHHVWVETDFAFLGSVRSIDVCSEDDSGNAQCISMAPDRALAIGQEIIRRAKAVIEVAPAPLATGSGKDR